MDIKSPVSIDELRTNLSQILGQVMYGNGRIVIKKYNRKAAVLISTDEYEKLLDPTKRLSKEEWHETVKSLDKIREGIPDIEPAVLERSIAEAVEEVRKTKRKRNR